MPFFVFNEMVASFVAFFNHFQFLVCPNAGIIPVIPRGWWLSGPCLRQCVHKMATIVGYHSAQGLSSEKCKQSGPTFPNFAALPGHTSTIGCRFSRL